MLYSVALGMFALAGSLVGTSVIVGWDASYKVKILNAQLTTWKESVTNDLKDIKTNLKDVEKLLRNE